MLNNCFIEASIKALLHLTIFKNIVNENQTDETLFNIKSKRYNKLSQLLLPERTTDTQEDCQEFLTNKLLPYLKSYILQKIQIYLTIEEIKIINNFVHYNKSKLYDFINEYKEEFNNNNKYYKYMHDFFDVKNIMSKLLFQNNKCFYYKEISISDLFLYTYITKDNEIYNSYTIELYNNENILYQLNQIILININPFIIIHINYINNENQIIPKSLSLNDYTYNLKSIIYYMSYNDNNTLGHYYNVNYKSSMNNYNKLQNHHSKAILLFYEIL